jgi:RNA polymerase sigma factor (sigma-70 family)
MHVALPHDRVTRQLCIRARQGSVSARERLIRTHLGLVIHVANYFYRPGAFLELGDLIQHGCLGLLRAIEKFNPKKRSRGTLVKFATYAHFWISHCIRREIQNHGRTIAVPVGQFKTAPPDAISMNQPDWMEDQDGIARIRLVDLDDTSDNWCREWEARRVVETLLARLSDRSRTIMTQRFGLKAGLDPLTQKQTAFKLGLNKSRVGQLEHQALRLLRHQAHQLHLLPF